MNIRPSPIAGSWYPANPRQLTTLLERYLSHADVPVCAGKIWGVVAPHAGYHFSGQVAAYAFKCLEGLRPDLIVVISPLHQIHDAPLLTSKHDAYQTPLGLVEVDQTAIAAVNQALRAHTPYELTPISADQEHAVEIELPFLQHILSPFRLLPIMIRAQEPDCSRALGQALAQALGSRQVLFVASSDLSHFYPHNLAQVFDHELLHRLEAFDPGGVLDADEEGVGFACGRGAIAAVLWATRQLGANHVTILHHATSGDVSGRQSSVVGYGAALIWQNGKIEA